MTWVERPGNAGVFPNEHREPDAREVEHDLDPADLADAYVELVDQDYLHTDLLADEWWEPDYVKERRRYRHRDL